MKTAFELFSEIYESTVINYPNKSWVNLDDPRIKVEIDMSIKAMELYANHQNRVLISVIKNILKNYTQSEIDCNEALYNASAISELLEEPKTTTI